MFYGEGDELGWHVDNADFVVTLMLQPSTSGGAFEYVPMLRSADDPNPDGVRALLSGDRAGVRALSPAPGTPALFRGRLSPHRVTPISGSIPRINAVLFLRIQARRRAQRGGAADLLRPGVGAGRASLLGCQCRRLPRGACAVDTEHGLGREPESRRRDRATAVVARSIRAFVELLERSQHTRLRGLERDADGDFGEASDSFGGAVADALAEADAGPALGWRCHPRDSELKGLRALTERVPDGGELGSVHPCGLPRLPGAMNSSAAGEPTQRVRSSGWSEDPGRAGARVDVLACDAALGAEGEDVDAVPFE